MPLIEWLDPALLNVTLGSMLIFTVAKLCRLMDTPSARAFEALLYDMTRGQRHLRQVAERAPAVPGVCIYRIAGIHHEFDDARDQLRRCAAHASVTGQSIDERTADYDRRMQLARRRARSKAERTEVWVSEHTLLMLIGLVALVAWLVRWAFQGTVLPALWRGTKEALLAALRRGRAFLRDVAAVVHRALRGQPPPDGWILWLEQVRVVQREFRHLDYRVERFVLPRWEFVIL